MTACPGACNATWRRTPEPERGEPVHGEPIWCTADTARIRRTLADLDTLAALLEHASDGYGEAPDQPGHTRNGHIPSPSPNFDTLDEIERMLAAWEGEYRRVKGWPSAPHHGRHASVSTEIVSWLTRHLDAILESPFAYEFGDEVLDASRQLVRKAKAGSGFKRGLVPCPRCDLKLLGSTDGGHVFWCGSCGRPVPKDEYDELCRAAAPPARAAT